MRRRINDCSKGFIQQGKIIPTGVNPLFSQSLEKSKRSRTDKNIHFLCVSRLSREKRVDVAVKAFIEANIPGSRLDIVGSGDQLSLLRKLTNDRNDIFFHNHVSNIDNLAKFYRDADVFILPSYRFDTQAITLSEAAVAGLPIIYCDDRLDVGVTEKNSLLASDPSPKAIADCMIQLSVPEIRQKMAKESTKIAGDLQPRAMAEHYVRLYRDLIKS